MNLSDKSNSEPLNTLKLCYDTKMVDLAVIHGWSLMRLILNHLDFHFGY